MLIARFYVEWATKLDCHVTQQRLTLLALFLSKQYSFCQHEHSPAESYVFGAIFIITAILAILITQHDFAMVDYEFFLSLGIQRLFTTYSETTTGHHYIYDKHRQV